MSRKHVGCATLSRRAALARIAAVGVTASMGATITGCGGGSGGSVASVPAPVSRLPPAPGSPLWKLQNALLARPPSLSAHGLTVTQGAQYSADPSLGTDAVIVPSPRGFNVNPNPDSLATVSNVWGHHRETWKQGAIGYIGSAAGNDSWYVPVTRWHQAATIRAFSTCAWHFVLDGRAFEVLFAGTNIQVTLVADGEFMTASPIETTLFSGVPGAALDAVNAYVRFDFGSSAKRRISLYASSSQGLCAIAVGKQDSLTPWDRSAEAAFSAMTDSYGQAPGARWAMGGPFWEAATLLGIPNLDLNAIGGTGYAPNNANNDTRDPGNAFVARIGEAAVTVPDLVLTGGGINDNNSFAAPPLYATGTDARAGFDSAVRRYFSDLRTALPNAVLAAMGPWAPVESMPLDAVAQSKADTVLGALKGISGPWVFLDNLRGGWLNSEGASAPQTGRGWQTGTGNVARPRGDGNGDLYVAADGVHPTPAGSEYLGGVMASYLRAAILAL